MEDLTPQVSQQANLFLGTIHDSSIRTLIQCLEYQFDNIPIDRSVIYQFHEIFQRIFLFFHFTKKTHQNICFLVSQKIYILFTSIYRPVILKRLYQLFNCLIDRKILTWNFFVSRFEVLINEVQNYNTHQKHIQESILLLKREDSPPDNFGINGMNNNPKKNLLFFFGLMHLLTLNFFSVKWK